MSANYNYHLAVIGSGPAGEKGAAQASYFGKKVVLVERWPPLGGGCLNVGCIPSKALLHAAKLIDECRDMGAHGIAYGRPEINVDKLRDWKDGIVTPRTSGTSAGRP